MFYNYGKKSGFYYGILLDFEVTREGRAIAVLPSGYSTPDIEGVGRSSLVLRLLGITFPYGRLLGLDNSALKSLEGNITISRQPNSWCRVLAMDIAYIGSSAGRLSIIPTKGEMISFIWDLARNIFRSTELEYRTGDHRKNSGRDKLYEIFYRIPLLKFIDIFGKLDALYPLDEIIILRRRIESSPLPPTTRVLTGDERVQQLRAAMLVSLQHGSAFWKRDPQTLIYRVDSILSKIDWDKICTIVELTISHPSLIIPYYVFDELAELIQKGKLPKRQEGPASVNIGSSIRYHNDTLSRSIHDVNEIQILVTSGEYLFKDAFFWKILSQVHKEFNLKLLLLDPDSPAATEREESTYEDKIEGFLRKEIRENIETIKRMSVHFSESGSQVHMQCKLYSELPLFRMTFIGMQRLLIASYLDGKRTGFDTVFYDIHADQENDLFCGFKGMYEKLESTAEPIALSV